MLEPPRITIRMVQPRNSAISQSDFETNPNVGCGRLDCQP